MKNVEIEEVNTFLDSSFPENPSHIIVSVKQSNGSYIELVALWVERPTLTQENIDYSQFNIGDYRVSNFWAAEPRKGHGTLLHNFLRNEIREELGGSILNIYSSKDIEPNDVETFSGDAKLFWKNRVEKKLAVYDSSLKRFKLLFKDEES
ncbi:hypothetical protein VB796_02665 [Arcicella sp. LKC2W]|uniref:hypothetical protein n=1 Tax=Arcicella sp. LKC2W TaxID=2984198 RepID=UPI002B1EFA00|nr:hypothetical protein [Arcicella sp. LKC2W]MEA5457918.1 hypothetical protein [Arcicella sp. LKC2W]